uniref:RNA helicase n=1 Tax=Globodera rostochiensis TaxID=31243 RepID=A0A914HYS3_GLORO
MAQRLFLLNPKCFASLLIRHASRHESSGPSFDFSYDKQQHSQPLGDQRTFYVQHKRNTGRIGGDTQFNHSPSRGQYRQNNVTGFGGRPRLNSFGKKNFDLQLNRINWKDFELQSFEKKFYKPDERVIKRDQSEIDTWMLDNACTLQGNDLPRPVLAFDEIGFPSRITEHLCKKFVKPTSIQSIAWPVALSGRDMVSIAMTGSGKTLAFILPAIVHLLGNTPLQPRDGPKVLVLLPTRELAKQVEEVSREYCQMMGLKVTCCYGGAARGPQEYALKQGVDICVATPGRIMDFLSSGVTNLRNCTYLVLDEADRMLDMGFEPQIRSVVGQIRPDRQTMMFSATWPRDVRSLANDFLTSPAHLNNVEVIEEYSKQDRLFEILRDIQAQPECKTLIFAETKRKVDELTRQFRRNGLAALCIHGDKTQREREWVLNEFREDRSQILLATEVAARGLDVNNIKYVINFDYPNNAEGYVHRIGRTGRQDKTGTAITFFTPQDGPKARELVDILEEAKQSVPDDLHRLCRMR